MPLDIAIHLVLEAIGGLTLRCVLGMCEHRRHQAIAWLTLALFSSTVTVWLVG